MADAVSNDWHLRAWAQQAGKRQADLVKELGWHKNAAHRLWHGTQPYRRAEINEVAAWLKIEPYELLMPPHEALQIRRVREMVAQEARAIAQTGAPAEPQPQSRTGTRG